MWRRVCSLEVPADLWLEEMLCQGGESYGLLPRGAAYTLRRSIIPERISENQKPLEPEPKVIFVDKYSEPHTSQQEDDLHDSPNSKLEYLKLQRHQLERDVCGLQNKLEQEVELHYALEHAFRQEAGVLPTLPNLPAHAQNLVREVAMLEVAISNLEEQIAVLSLQLGHEQRERELIAGGACLKLPIGQNIPQNRSPHAYSSLDSDYKQPPPCCSASNALSDSSLTQLYSPPPSVHRPANQAWENLTSPTKQTSCKNQCNGPQSDCLVDNAKAGCKHFWQPSSLSSPDKMKSKYPIFATSPVHSEMALKAAGGLAVQNSWHHPNRLSEEMVKCMVSIYQHLADPTSGLASSQRVTSPMSPHGNAALSSVSSISESSSMSLTQSPPSESQGKHLGMERTFDPYRTPEKVPWSDIGAYVTAIEVSEMSVGKDQLEYAAEALRMFRSLVEQLSRVNPSTMKHEEKVAFWINVYNALMMHAYLAYGVPKNDFKFFSLMQKAAYTVGGHSFNAVVIEHLLLKAKAQWYKPQMALLLAHQKLKLREEVSTFAIDHVEPLVAFALSFGACSSPAVRVYTAQNVQDELQCALQDYARASVSLSTKGKLLIPKLLLEFGLELVEEGNVVDWICQFLPCQQSSLIRSCMRHRQRRFLNSKHYSVVPFDFHFRYLFLPGQV